MDEKIKVAMVTGHHEYDVVDFQQMLRAIPDVDFYPQHLEDFALDTEEARSAYNVLAFYNFQQDLPTERDAFDRDLRRPLAELGDHGQGIFMLHHALTAFPGWLHWQEICGIGDTTKPKSLATAKIDQDLTIEIADAEHPITKGLSSWQMIRRGVHMPGSLTGQPRSTDDRSSRGHEHDRLDPELQKLQSFLPAVRT